MTWASPRCRSPGCYSAHPRARCREDARSTKRAPERHWPSGRCPGCWSSTTPPRRPSSALTDAVVAGAHDDAIEGVEVVVRPALEATADDVLGADGYLLGTTANFGYMSGALKHFFDSIFLEAGGALATTGRRRGSRRQEAVRAVGARPLRHRPARCGRCCRSSRRCRGSQSAEVLEVLGDVGERAARRRRTSSGGDARGTDSPRAERSGIASDVAMVRYDERRAVGCCALRPAVLALLLLALPPAARSRAATSTPDQVDSVEAPELGACRVLTPRGRGRGEQRHPHRRLRGAAHRRDVRRRRPARRVRGRGLRVRGARRVRLPHLLRTSSRSSSAPTRAW